ncbi:MAG TPA: hypothetical protein PK771_11635 [Spirochaetota bacterium]|nr:hypothetical protein [Spirochaetota bacterium]
MIIEKKDSWKIFAEEGEDFYNAVVKGQNNKKIFTPTILYSLSYLAIQKYAMAFLIYNKTMPDIRSLKSTLDEVKKIIEIPNQLYNSVIFLDEFQEICVMDNYSRKIPDEDDIPLIIDALTEIKDFVLEKIPDFREF